MADSGKMYNPVADSGKTYKPVKGGVKGTDNCPCCGRTMHKRELIRFECVCGTTVTMPAKGGEYAKPAEE